MKYLIYIILFLFFLCFSCTKKENNYEWKDLSFKNDIHLTSIVILDDELGFVGGRVKFETEEIIRMRSIPSPYCCDTLVLSPDKEHFYIEYIFKDPQTIDPLLYKTINGGIAWQAIQTPFKTGIKDMNFIDESHGYVVTEYEGVYKTIDGGQNWSKILGNLVVLQRSGQGILDEDPFESVHFLNKDTGFAYGPGIVLKTTDGGMNWDCISHRWGDLVPGGYPNLFSIVQEINFPNSKDTGYLLNHGSELYKTVNQGKDWELVYEETDKVEGAVFYNSNQIFIPSSNVYSQNGGVDWKKDSLYNHFFELVVTPNFIDFYSWDTFVAIGKIKKSVWGIDQRHDMSIENDGFVVDLVFPSKNTGYAIGYDSGIEPMIWKYSASNY